MCRGIIYLGRKTTMHPFTHLAANSLVNQSVSPKFMYDNGVNLTGNGFISWQHKGKKISDPILYKSKLLPFYDNNFNIQTKMIETNCFIAHIRGGALSSGVILTEPNAHPFFYEGAQKSAGTSRHSKTRSAPCHAQAYLSDERSEIFQQAALQHCGGS